MKPLSVKRVNRKVQSPEVYSFSGGSPNMPADIAWPSCGECERPLTFFFQIRFPEGHPWVGKIMVMFHCVECISWETCFPKHIDLVIAEGGEEAFLENYQSNFRHFVFAADQPTVLRTDYPAKVKYQVFEFAEMEEDTSRVPLKVGGEPIKKWMDGGVLILKRGSMVFLMQMKTGYTFPKLPDAPFQIELPLSSGETFRKQPNYTLFYNNNTLWLYGTQDSRPPKVLVSITGAFYSSARKT